MHLHQSTYLESYWSEKSDLFLVTSKQKSKLTQYPTSGSVSVIHTIWYQENCFPFSTKNRDLHVCLKVCVGLFHICWRWLWHLKLVVVILRKSTAVSISWVVLSYVCNYGFSVLLWLSHHLLPFQSFSLSYSSDMGTRRSVHPLRLLPSHSSAFMFPQSLSYISPHEPLLHEIANYTHAVSFFFSSTLVSA